MPGFSWPFGGSSQSSEEQSTTQDDQPNVRSHSRLEIFKDLNGFLKERNPDEGSDQEEYECDVRDLNPFDIIYIRDKTDNPSTDGSRLNHRVMLITRVHEGNGMTCLPFRRTSSNRSPKGREKHWDVVQETRTESDLQPVQSRTSALKNSLKLFVELDNGRELREGLVLSFLEPWHVEYDRVHLSTIGYVSDASRNATIDKLIDLTIQTFNVLRID